MTFSATKAEALLSGLIGLTAQSRSSSRHSSSSARLQLRSLLVQISAVNDHHPFVSIDVFLDAKFGVLAGAFRTDTELMAVRLNDRVVGVMHPESAVRVRLHTNTVRHSRPEVKYFS